MGDAGRQARNKGHPSSAAARAVDADDPVQPGDHVGPLGRYKILDRIGRGGMGIVFKAHDVRLKRDVALKCPWPRPKDDVVRKRFEREAQSVSKLSHPHVVPIFEILEWRGLPWLVMELVDGHSLYSLLQNQQPLPLPRVLEAAEGLADSLRAAHSKGIIHRDINPNNILIRDDGWALLTDFGIAAEPSANTASEPLTEVGRVIGTAGYMSPEQLLGQPLDPRTDIFSLGAVLYEMCTGRRAFEAGEGGNANDAILHREPPPIAWANGESSPGLERIIRKALAKQPANRQQDARELVTEISGVRRRLESAEYMTVAPVVSAGAFHRSAAWAGAFGIVIVAAVTIPSLVGRYAPQEDVFPAGSPLQVTSDPGYEAEPAISPDGGLIAYTATASDTSDIWITDPKGGSRLRLTADAANDRSPAWFPDGSALAFVSDRGGEEGVWKVPRLGGTAVLLIPNGVDPAVSPDGRLIAFARRNSAGYYRIAVATPEVLAPSRWITTDQDGVRDHIQPAWSPDGRTLCYGDARNLWVVRMDDGRPRPLTSENMGDFEPVWSPDGRYVIFSSLRGGTQALWRVAADGGLAQRLTIGTGPESHASLSLDGSRVAYSTYLNDYDIVLVDRKTGERQLIESRFYESAPSFAPDGTAIAFTSGRAGGASARLDLWLQPLRGGRPSGPARQLTDLPRSVNTPAFSPDGRWVAFKGESEGRVDIWVTGVSGGLPQRFTDASGSSRHPAWSPDGTTLAYILESGARAHVWMAPIRDGRPAGPPRQLTRGETTDQVPAWSPDGRMIAYVSQGERHDEIRLAPITGGASRVLARRAGVGQLRWERATGWLWFNAVSPRGMVQLWKMDPAGRDPVKAATDDLFAEAAPAGDFELSSDGRLLAYTRQQTRGDIWLVARSEPN